MKHNIWLVSLLTIGVQVFTSDRNCKQHNTSTASQQEMQKLLKEQEERQDAICRRYGVEYSGLKNKDSVIFEFKHQNGKETEIVRALMVHHDYLNFVENKLLRLQDRHDYVTDCSECASISCCTCLLTCVLTCTYCMNHEKKIK